MSRHLIVGLGNPGRKYERTRHNVGFMVVDQLAERHRLRLATEKFGGRYDSGRIGDAPVDLLEPMSYMNRSGGPVSEAASFYGLDASQIVVVHDEIDLPAGALRVKAGGGHGGHNGLRDIIARLGSRDFIRVRVGVGRPEHGDVTGHVLGEFGASERQTIAETIEDACDAVETIVSQGVDTAQNRFNRT